MGIVDALHAEHGRVSGEVLPSLMTNGSPEDVAAGLSCGLRGLAPDTCADRFGVSAAEDLVRRSALEERVPATGSAAMTEGRLLMTRLTVLARWSAVVLLAALPAAAYGQNVSLGFDASLPQAAYAAGRLDRALTERGFVVVGESTAHDYRIDLAIDQGALGKDAFAIVPRARTISVNGGDATGLVYGSLALVEALRNGTSLGDVRAVREAPRLPFRAIKHNLPWDTYRPSLALDQHYDTCRRVEYWEAFLDMMAEQRFNALTLWTLHPFTYMIRPTNFPEASRFSDEELAEWRALHTSIFRMARERGIDTYIVTWSIFISEELARAHNVGLQNFSPHFYGPGDTSEIIKRYTRESVTQVLKEYPDLTGWGITHGEGMGGMTPRQRQEWMDEVMIAGMLNAGRPVKLIHRAPLSAGLSPGGSTSEDAERITRAAIERLGAAFDGPIWVEMKFNWSHAHSTPRLVKVHGGKLGRTYFEPEPSNYKVTWMARNEDFFALRWGVPGFIRAHIAENSASYVGGYFVGSETYIPAKDYFTAIAEPVGWRYAFERQWLFYMLWGRLLFDPDTPDEVFRRAFVRRYGPQAAPLLEAYARASATALRLASAWDSRWDFTLYSEGFLALEEDPHDHERSEMSYISVDRLINRAPLDPDYVSVRDYVAAGGASASFRPGQVTPPVLIRMLEEDGRRALELVAGIETGGNASLMYEVADVQAWAHLGRHFAEKLRGAVALQTYRTSGGDEHRTAAVRHLTAALAAWDDVVRITRPLYRDMHLTHMMGGRITRRDGPLFHWEHVRPHVARDVELARDGRVETRD
jgi:hypothetical protein